MDKQNAQYIYIASAVVILLIIVIIAQLMRKSRLVYTEMANIAVKTSKGLIKLRADKIAYELEKIVAELNRHKGFERTGARYQQIDELIDNLKLYIESNPGVDLNKQELRMNIIHRAMSDMATFDRHIQDAAYKTITDYDELEQGTDVERFDYMLKNVNIVIDMLKHNICENGVVDLYSLENLLHLLDVDLSNSETGYFETPLGQEIGNKYDPYMIPRLALFESQQSQIEGFSRETDVKPHHPEKTDLILGAQNARNAQMRSQLFRENRQMLGTKQYNDEDLLYIPTYHQLAL